MKNFCLQYTSWEEMPAQVQALFVQWMGNDAERAQAFYEMYFYWYAIPHEVGHILRAWYSTRTTSHWREETTANSIAVAYWRARGETERLSQVRQLTADALSRLKDPVPQGESREEHLDAHYSELGSNPSAYGYYQFSMVLAAMDERIDFVEALRSFVTSRVGQADPPLTTPYPATHRELPLQIVCDMRSYLMHYGLVLPEIQIIRAFSPMIIFVDWDDKEVME